jgi:predicted amidohydrolase
MKKIALIQAELIWENPEANRVYFEEKINAISDDVNLIVLPEMFTRFTMNQIKLQNRCKVKQYGCKLWRKPKTQQ